MMAESLPKSDCYLDSRCYRSRKEARVVGIVLWVVFGGPGMAQVVVVAVVAGMVQTVGTLVSAGREQKHGQFRQYRHQQRLLHQQGGTKVHSIPVAAAAAAAVIVVVETLLDEYSWALLE